MGNRQWDIPKLRDLLEKIIPQNSVLEDYEIKHEFESIRSKRMLLNARKIVPKEASGQELILLAIEDVTEKNTKT